MRDIVEFIAIFLLFLALLSIAYCFIMFMFNGMLSCTEFRIKLPVQKRFVGKMTPIYRLTNWELDKGKRVYFIQKWVIEYSDFDIGCWQTVLIPFSTLFQRLQYVEKESFNIGELPDDVVATLDLEKNWNYEYNKWLTKNRKEEAKSDKFKAMMNNLNKDFNENYTE